MPETEKPLRYLVHNLRTFDVDGHRIDDEETQQAELNELAGVYPDYVLVCVSDGIAYFERKENPFA